MGNVSRRLFLLGGMAAAGTLGVPAWALANTGAGTQAIQYPFELGVASGDPRPDGVVLWTRLAPAPLNPDGRGGMPATDFTVSYEIATDSAFTSIVQTGTAPAPNAQGHSVHAEVTGLQPGREYYYRFKVETHVSPVGRTVTAPAAGTTPAQLKFAFASCQHFEEGWYIAHKGIAADRPDLVLFLGDYMYENPSGIGEYVRRYVITSEADTLAEYRHRYSQHKTDPNLRAAHAAAPWLVVFDDHEIENNWNSTNQTAARKTAAFQAFWENMPLRNAQKPSGATIPLYRQVNWGGLARFHMLDTRQYRSAQVTAVDPNRCSQMNSTSRTLTGTAQEQWLTNAFATHPAKWDFLGQQVFFAQRDTDGLASTCDDKSSDAWDGYDASRDRIANAWVNAGVPNPVVLTGDVHRHWAADLRLDYYNKTSPIIGSEFVTTSVTSGGRGGDTAPPNSTWFANNPHVKYVLDQRGYIRMTVTPAQVTAEYMKVLPHVLDANATVSVDRRWALLDGVRGLQSA